MSIDMRHCIHYEFINENNAAEVIISISLAYSINSFEVRTSQNWFAWFRDGEIMLEDKESTCRPNLIVKGDLKALIEEDPRQSTRDLENI